MTAIKNGRKSIKNQPINRCRPESSLFGDPLNIYVVYYEPADIGKLLTLIPYSTFFGIIKVENGFTGSTAPVLDYSGIDRLIKDAEVLN